MPYFFVQTLKNLHFIPTIDFTKCNFYDKITKINGKWSRYEVIRLSRSFVS